jgi:hypothetical protein
METLLHIDWKAVFVPTVSLLEIVLRGTGAKRGQAGVS